MVDLSTARSGLPLRGGCSAVVAGIDGSADGGVQQRSPDQPVQWATLERAAERPAYPRFNGGGAVGVVDDRVNGPAGVAEAAQARLSTVRRSGFANSECVTAADERR